MCRRVTLDSIVLSEPSKVTMVLCSSTECLYAAWALICDVTNSWISLPCDWLATSHIGMSSGNIPDTQPGKPIPRQENPTIADVQDVYPNEVVTEMLWCIKMNILCSFCFVRTSLFTKV
ncbi:hypothetical protein AVEN_50274-1 [Araneus ventricosus]|uniref:Uncharacterized protein n=1 Tax=Araneus ventricosus TaxID=182803 RepID=A0A4Y2G454_ARAVE|nr:hypothetical protein AVEN_50274-1 [Araneus ventricosus]